MRINENTIICGDKVILVPYRAEHVPTYHEWMKSPELLELTASEPLSLEEEYEMQRKWHTDEDSKELTFILLARPPSRPPSTHLLLAPDQLRECKMIGDVNMFLPDGLAEDGECEIMIASKEDRGKGYALEAMRLFLSYAITNLNLPPTRLMARIGRSNTPSIALFRKLEFGVVKVVEVFQEVEMRWGHRPEGDTGGGEKGGMLELGCGIPEGRIGVYDSHENSMTG